MSVALKEIELEKVRREKERRAITSSLSEWESVARPNQRTPQGHDWSNWLILAGRGFGKTRTGAEDVKHYGLTHPKSRIAIVAPTFADARDTCIEGESGLYNILPSQTIRAWNRSIGELALYNGTLYKLFSADKPDRLRGPQFHRAWCDELGSWRYGVEAWDMLQFGLRLGQHPQVIVTTTPKPTKLVKELYADKSTVRTEGNTYENAANLAPSFLERIKKKYEGTRLGNQEIYAKILEDTPGALWTSAILESLRVTEHPELVRVGVGIDPSISSGNESAETGIIVQGIDQSSELYTLEDASIQGTPHEWATAALATYHKFKADFIVVETNQGGEMVEHTIRSTAGGQNVRIIKVHASRGKYTRAEPISAIYEQGRAHHVGYFPELESQMTTWVPGDTSPDRMDALVWIATELTQGGQMPELDDSSYNILTRGYS
jgi:phage terminase large subunit-like protein